MILGPPTFYGEGSGLKKMSSSDTANENNGKEKTGPPHNGAVEGHVGKMVGELLTGGGIRALPWRAHMEDTSWPATAS